MTNHEDLTLELWSQFSLDQQFLMIGNEMNRALNLMEESDTERRQGCYERALQLVDLTLGLKPRAGICRELGLWRTVIADLHERRAPDLATHRTAFRVLLQMRPALAAQVEALGL